MTMTLDPSRLMTDENKQQQGNDNNKIDTALVDTETTDRAAFPADVTSMRRWR